MRFCPCQVQKKIGRENREITKKTKDQAGRQVTNLRGQSEPVSLIFPDAPFFLENTAFGKRRFSQETRCSQETEKSLRNPQQTADCSLSPYACPCKRGPPGHPLLKSTMDILTTKTKKDRLEESPNASCCALQELRESQTTMFAPGWLQFNSVQLRFGRRAVQEVFGFRFGRFLWGKGLSL